MELKSPYLIFLGDARDALAAKTGQGIVDWHPEVVLGQLRLPGCEADLGQPDLALSRAVELGAQTFVIGTVSPGGVMPESWRDILIDAVNAGLDIASGLHTRLSDVPGLRDVAAATGRRLIDVRHPTEIFPTGTGAKRSGRRLLTVGTDCSVGKKYTALCLVKELIERGFDAEFAATGQTGVMIAGRGVCIDAVVADFISGAAETLSPSAADDHWFVVEGQGALKHPSFAGVTLGLLHGSQPDAFVVCHEPTRTTQRNVLTPVPTIAEIIDLTLVHGRTVNADIRCAGIAVNTSALGEDAARALVRRLSGEYGVPATDPVRFGVDLIADGLLR